MYRPGEAVRVKGWLRRIGAGSRGDVEALPSEVSALAWALVDSQGQVVYTPPEGASLIRDMLANWERYLHEAEDVDPLIRMAVGHYQFEAIHPFIDGNGRTGRILNLLFLLEQDLLEVL